MKLKYKLLIKDTSTNQLKVIDTIFKLNDKVCSSFNSKIVNQLFGLNIFDKNKQEVFQGDILKITYQDRNSNIFQKMKEENDEIIYMFLKPDEDFLRTIASFNDEVKYFSTNEDITTFLRYLSKIECFEIIGNIYNNKDFVNSILKTKKDYDLIQQKENKEIVTKEFSKFIDIIRETFIKEKHYFPEEVSLYDISLKEIKISELFNSYNDSFEIILNVDLNINIDFDNYKYDFINNNYNHYLASLITELYNLIPRKEFKRKYPFNKYMISKSSNKQPNTKCLLETNFNKYSNKKQSFELNFLIQID